jgi:hypothetical protein
LTKRYTRVILISEYGGIPMVKERDTAIIPARVKKTTIAVIKEEAGRRAISVNAWLNEAIDNWLWTGRTSENKSSQQPAKSQSDTVGV